MHAIERLPKVISGSAVEGSAPSLPRSVLPGTDGAVPSIAPPPMRKLLLATALATDHADFADEFDRVGGARISLPSLRR